MNTKVKEVLDTILDQFQKGNIPELVALSTYPVSILPMNKWSLLNQLLCYITGLTDFRGYKQWLEVKRHVKKGEKATHILVPWIKKDTDEQTNEDKSFLAGFITASVFAVEQTDGEQLDYQKLELPPFPLMERAIELGVNVAAIPGSYEHYGYYSQTKKVIALASPEECVFFHEVCHLADDKITGIKNGQDPIQEIVAELGALALCQIVGLDGSKHFGNNYRYIETYAKKLELTPYGAVLKVLSRTEKILNFLLKEEEHELCSVSQ
jgi:antirestriction protein ArdC